MALLKFEIYVKKNEVRKSVRDKDKKKEERKKLPNFMNYKRHTKD